MEGVLRGCYGGPCAPSLPPVLPANIYLGDSIVYTITITILNPGDFARTDVVVTEGGAGSLNQPCLSTLATGQRVSRTVPSTISTNGDTNGTTTATVTAKAQGVDASGHAVTGRPSNPVVGRTSPLFQLSP